jgi:hypothetical protein
MKKIYLILFAFISVGLASADEVPVVASYSMAPNEAQPLKLVDQSGTKSDGILVPGATFANDPDRGPVLKLDGVTGSAEVKQHHMLDRLGMEMTCTAWIKLDALPALHKFCPILVKASQGDAPFKFGIYDNGALHFQGAVGANTTDLGSPPHAIKPGQWYDVAFTYKTGAEVAIYIDGKQVAHGPALYPLQPNDQSLFIGVDGKTSHFSGELGAIHLYAQALTADQIGQDQNGGLDTRPATLADMPAVLYRVDMSLGRYDMPGANTDGYGRIHQVAQRRGGPDAIDWPAITLDGTPLFAAGDSAKETRFIRKRTGAEASSKFEEAGDCIIEPGHHWLRPLAWRWGRNYVYSDDRYARYFSGVYELWVFPVQIEGAGQQDVHDIELKYQGQTIYQQPGPFHSLTLLLPASAPGQPYSLTVAGRDPVSFEVGLLPVDLGHPKDIIRPVELVFSGSGPKITVRNLARPDTFPQQADWDKDVAALASYVPDTVAPSVQTPSMQSRLGLTVPRSPVTVNAISLPAGMSGGFFFNGADGHGATHAFAGTPDDYGHYLSDIGYDRVFEFTELGSKALASDPRSLDAVAVALAHSGVQLGIVPGMGWYRPSINHANISLFAWTLPDFCQPLYRRLQIQAQRFQPYGNFAGVSIGADNGGYVSYWNWAPPIPDRPWPEAMNALFQGKPVRIPVSAAVGGSLEAKEYFASNVKEVVDYLAKYDETFTDFDYFDKGLKEVDPKALATCGMFGSSPGGLGRGGWPAGSMPGKQIFSGLDVQQAYDWNEDTSTLPMHNVALLDRLRSYDPKKTTWALIDDFALHMDRGLRQRAYALALTRGIQAVGTTFVANPTGDRARPDILADQKELYSWVHRYGGAYAMSEPEAKIGILYVHSQSLLLGPGGGSDLDDPNGPHEGKTTEALFLCSAAGWPARIITPEELKRGIDPNMKAILLVGLNQFDSSWTWYDALTDALKQYVNQGGRILLDDESVCPVPSTSTGMKVNAYVAQRALDWTPELLARNTDNIAKLNQAMNGISKAVATSNDPTIWTVPTRAGDTEYVTVVNQLMQSVPWNGKPDARRVMKGQAGSLVWNTTRPIYDVRLMRRITPEEAAKVDLTHDAFQWYALPPEEVSAPSVAFSDGTDGYKQVLVSMAGKGSMNGIPIELTVKSAKETVTLFTATGLPTRLPVRSDDAFGAVDVAAKELLSGLSGHAILQTKDSAAPMAVADTSAVHVVRPDDVKLFGARRQEPLTIALTDKQAADPEMNHLAETVAAYYRGLGRTVEMSRAEPNQLVLSRQPYAATQPYPQWKTVESDLVLFGSPNDNVLLMDQDRGYLLPPGIDQLKPGHGIVCPTFSPFVGECQAINIIARDSQGLQAGVNSLVKADAANVGSTDR